MTTKKETKSTNEFDFRSIQKPEDAFRKQGMDPAVMPDLSKLPERFGFLAAVFILAVIIEAVNNGWKADYSDHNQKKYFPWGSVSSVGLVFSYSLCPLRHCACACRFPPCFGKSGKGKICFHAVP